MQSNNVGISSKWVLIIFAPIFIIALIAVVVAVFSSKSGGRPGFPAVSSMYQIFLAMNAYADHNHDRYPWAGENKMPWDHFQLLVDEGYIEEPSIFVSRGLGDEPAEIRPDGTFKLCKDTCSFTYINKPTIKGRRPLDRVIIATNRIAEPYSDGYVYQRMDASRGYYRFADDEPKKLPDHLIKVDF